MMWQEKLIFQDDLGQSNFTFQQPVMEIYIVKLTTKTIKISAKK
jgi:hypothetical protein